MTSRRFLLAATALAAGCAGCRQGPAPTRLFLSRKLGLSMRVPATWTESPMMIADDNRCAVGEDAGGGVTMIFTREPGRSYSRRFPNLPQEVLSLQLVRADLEGGAVRHIREIPIAGSAYYYGVHDIAAEPPLRSLRAFFWNSNDAFNLTAAALATRFDHQEAVFTAVLRSLAYLPLDPPPALETLPRLAPLPVAYSNYVRPLRTTAAVVKDQPPGLPANIVRFRHSWGAGWMEALVRQDELLHVRRKVVLLPFGNPGLEAQVAVELDLQNATGIKTWSTEFRTWAHNAIAAFLQNYPVDTRRSEGPLSIHFQRAGKDLLIDYARVETARALEAAARGN